MKNIKLRKTILAVDDMLVNLTTLKAILQDYYTVCLAKSGKDALRILERTQVDVILLDIEMPEMSGIELFIKLQENPMLRSIPVIFVTTSASPEIVRQVVALGPKDYVVKPIDVDILLDKIEKALLSIKVDPAVVFLSNILFQLGKACEQLDIANINILMQHIVAEQYIPTVTIILQRILVFINNHDYPPAAHKIRELLEFLNKSDD
ncbi:MAG: response regulator [Treponema sp.]|jgi:putative two-component system response regulator|nr:response regulator [Treponema sp.]